MKAKTGLLVFCGIATLLTAGGLLYYTPTLDLYRWLELALLLIMLVFFQFRGVGVSSYIKLSLSVSVYLASIFVYGTGEAIWLAVLSNIIYGLLAKIQPVKIYLNLLQRSLTSLIVGAAFSELHGQAQALALPSSLGPMFISLVLYTFVNLSLVSVLSMFVRPDLHPRNAEVFKAQIWVNSMLYGYTGIVYAVFISNWQLAGLLIFGVLMIGVSELMHFSLQMVAEQQRRIKAEQELILDSKTKVYNYRFLSDWLDQKSTMQVTMLFIDIDDFWAFNDLFGHEYGDLALYTVAQTIAKSIREDDQVIRFGGDEFVVILPNTPRSRGVLIAKRIQARLAELSDTGLARPLTVSIGIASYPEDAGDRMELLRRADMAMYRAKSMGKNQCCSWAEGAC
ncbi:MAG TPA: GGDEF domain-containing protein [Limnochordia bacterium]|jgi:diguanylate cyclase (GGDEF)-like protein|nr:GGDEF domain-containing protein [Bacillota bacterium]HOB09192.1 GGDEF domain-containing protein [Limnochordia bacterium]NLH32114.1 GGDEF domain-containing protein [Bacillota bacterium]HPT93904.1 GGDEF domain-containing protein [Limnochordia bacterium]HPZ30096.1 GGDEF domain-containing protein [Limnochordia bacterium]